MGTIARFSFLILYVSLLTAPSQAASPDYTKTKPLDGVAIEAVETYWNPKQSELNLGIGFYPFNAYYTGVCLNGGYTYHATRNFSWEVFNGSYFSTFDKGLTTQLADKYNVNPAAIERLQFILSTNIDYVFSYGKFVFLEDFIRYFRASSVTGLALANTSLGGNFAVNFGLKLEVFTGKTFSWRFEVRDALAISGLTNYVTISLGTGFNF